MYGSSTSRKTRNGRLLEPLLVVLFSLAVPVSSSLASSAAQEADAERPNILLIVTDDQSWLHLGCYGDEGLNTPNLDRLAAQGVRFNYAYTAAPSCTASRSGLLTGQEIWRLEEGGVFGCTLPRKFPVFPVLLEESGYAIGHTGKGWGPGNLKVGGWTERGPLGKAYNGARVADRKLAVSSCDYAGNLERFLGTRPEDRPFFFWVGMSEPHRGYRKGSGLRAGKELADATLPGHLPAVPPIQSDVLDCYLEIEYIDGQVGRMLELLNQHGLFDNTLIMFTSDNGMPFPRAKANLYDAGTRMPLIVAWKDRAPSGRVVDDFVSLTDLGPTTLEAAGVTVPDAMTGRSLMPILTSNQDGRVDPQRDAIVLGHERHTHLRCNNRGYPVRAIRTHKYMYLRNYQPDRWPAGDPDIDAYDDGYNNIDRSPTKSWMRSHADDPTVQPLFQLAFGKRPAEELYDMQADPWQLRNLADESSLADVKQRLRKRMRGYLTRTDDPRMQGRSPWDNYPCLYGRYPYHPAASNESSF